MSLRERIDGLPEENVLQRLVERAREEGASEIVVETTHESGEAWIRSGFTETARVLSTDVDSLERRLGDRGTSFGSIHVQSDDVDSVAEAVRSYVPRLPGHSRGSVVAP